MKKDLTSVVKFSAIALSIFFIFFLILVFYVKKSGAVPCFSGITGFAVLMSIIGTGIMGFFLAKTELNEFLKQASSCALIFTFILVTLIEKASFLSVLWIIATIGLLILLLIWLKKTVIERGLIFYCIMEAVIIIMAVFLTNFLFMNPGIKGFITGLSLIVLSITTIVLLYDILIREEGFGLIAGIAGVAIPIVLEVIFGFCSAICEIMVAIWIIAIIVAMIYIIAEVFQFKVLLKDMFL